MTTIADIEKMQETLLGSRHENPEMCRTVTGAMQNWAKNSTKYGIVIASSKFYTRRIPLDKKTPLVKKYGCGKTTA